MLVQKENKKKMKKIGIFGSLLALLLWGGCDKHEELITPPSCELITMSLQEKICPPEGEHPVMEVWFAVVFGCEQTPDHDITIHTEGEATYQVISSSGTSGITTVTYRALIQAVSGATVVTATVRVDALGTAKHLTISCPVPPPDDPDEPCTLGQISLVEKLCPSTSTEAMIATVAVSASCPELPTWQIDVQDNGHHVVVETIDITHQGNLWTRTMKVTATPSTGSSQVTVTVSVVLEGESEQVIISCPVPTPEVCTLHDLQIVGEHWITEETVEIELDVWFKNCGSVPVFDISTTTVATEHLQYISTRYAGEYLIYRVKSRVTTSPCATQLAVTYTVSYEGETRTVTVSETLCAFQEVRNEIVQHPYQGDATRAIFYFDVVFSDVHVDPLYTVAITDDIPNEEIDVEVLQTIHQGNLTILKMVSHIKAPQPLYNTWITYDLSYCGKGVKLTVDF